VNRRIYVIGLSLAMFSAVVGMSAQKQTPAKATPPQKQTSSPREFGKSYVTLRPEQKKLVDDYVRHYNQITGNKIATQAAYDGARLSVRTTFDAVTHALLNAKMTDANAAEMVSLFNFRVTKLGAMDFNIAHTMEHYGNLVTYMRLKGIVPPSSTPPPPAASKKK